MSLLNLIHQVTARLPVRFGGTGNALGYGQGVITPAGNKETSTMPLGSVVRFSGSRRVKLVDSTRVKDTAGVVVGYYAGGDPDRFVAADCPAGEIAAVMLQGICAVLTSDDVSINEYAIVAGTPGSAEGQAAMGAGCFGQWVQEGVYSTRPLVLCRLFGNAAAIGSSSAAVFGTPNLTYGTSAAAGSTDEVIRRDATLAVFDGTVPTTIAFGDSAATGSAGKSARRDHKHGFPTLYGGFDVVLYGPAVDDVVDIEVPFAMTVTLWTVMLTGTGSIVLDIWKQAGIGSFPPTDADSITASAPPTVSSAQAAQSSTLTGWTTSLARGDVLRIHVDSVSSVDQATLSIRGTKA